MKNIYFSLVIFIITSLSLISQSIDLTIDVINAPEVHTKLNGFNTGPTFNHVFLASDTPMMVTDHCDGDENDYWTVSMTPNPDFVEKTAAINPSALRFPGGTISNYYHLYEYEEDGTYDPSNPIYSNGFGVQDDETKFYATGNVIRKQYCIWDNQVQMADPNENPNFIEGFKNLVLAIEAENGTSLDVIYVANILSHFQSRSYSGISPFGNWTIYKGDDLTPSDPSDILNVLDPNDLFELYYKENIDAINFLLDNGINVVGVELGNELYFGEYSDASFQGHSNITSQSFMELAEIYTARIKAEHSNMKISLPTDANSNSWHNTVLNYPNPFYDAISLHAYYNEPTCIQNNNAHCTPGCTSGNLITDWNCRFECGKCALDDYVKEGLYTEMEETLLGLPADKKIWFTEWNLINPGNTQAINLDYTNTFLHAAYVFEHYLKQLEFNSNHDNPIEYSFHHRLGYKLDWSIVESQLGIGNTIKSSYYAFELLDKLNQFEEIKYIESVELLDTVLENDANIHTFYVHPMDGINENSGKLYLAYTNKSDSPISINGIQDYFIDEYGFFNTIELVQIHHLTGNNTDGLYATFGEIKLSNSCNNILTGCNTIAEIDRTDDPSLIYTDDEIFDLSDDALPPFSMGIIEMDISYIIIDTDEIYSDNQLNIYPNPVNDILHVSLDNHNEIQEMNVRILDVQGRTILNSSNGNYPEDISLNVGDINAGIYFLEISSSKGIYTSKIIIE